MLLARLQFWIDLLPRIRSFVRAVWSLFWKGDVDIVDYNQREAACYKCDQFNCTRHGMFCGACGCPPSPVSDMRTKWRMTDLRCPLNKW